MGVYLASIFLGWSLGANDAANTFGTAVASRMVSFRLAAFLIAVFVVLGAGLQGAAGMETLQGLAAQTPRSAAMAPLAAGATLTLLTMLKLPASASQATVGAIVGLGLARGGAVDWSGVGKVAICWIGTPLGAIVVCIGVYRALARLLRWWNPSLFVYDPVMRAALIACGCYSAYALGANNVANVAAMLAEGSVLTAREAALTGGLCIALGAATYSHGVMMTVGRGMVKLDVFSALCCVLALAIVMHVYAMIGVPVSSSQGIIGALLGIGWVKGLQAVRFPMLGRIVAGWFATPVLAGLCAMALWRFWGAAG